MNVSLTSELEEYVQAQVESGHYRSASEVVREALRNQIRLSMKDRLDARIEQGRSQVKNRDLIAADESYFDNKRKMIQKKYSGKSSEK